MSTIKLRTDDGSMKTVHVDKDIDFVQDGSLVLFLGEMVTVAVHVRADGTTYPEVLERWSADSLPSLTSEQFLSQMTPGALEHAEPILAPDDLLQARKLPQKVVRLTFRQLSDRSDTVLIVEDGYDQAVDYRAFILHARGNAEPTTVCQAPPHVMAYEHWPYPIMMIGLNSFVLLRPADMSDACD